MDRATIRAFVEKLDLAEADKQRLLDLSPADYTGMAARIVDLLD
jgi:adenylosuccinate lyase